RRASRWPWDLRGIELGERENDRRYRTIRLLRGQPEPPQRRIEPHPSDPERGRRGRLVALGFREGIRDRVPFELLKGRRGSIRSRGARWRGGTRQGRLVGREPRQRKPELCGGDEPGVRHDQRSLDRVLEFP